jgi:hypothetical protein
MNVRTSELTGKKFSVISLFVFREGVNVQDVVAIFTVQFRTDGYALFVKYPYGSLQFA